MALSQPRYRADLSYSEPITADELTVKFDGVLYQVKKDARGGYGNRGLGSNAGAPGLPFYIVRGDGVNGVFTESSGQHTIEILEGTSSIETTECFKKAVKSVVGGSSIGGGGTSEPLIVKASRMDTEAGRLYFNATPNDVLDAISKNRQVFFKPSNGADAEGWALMYFSPLVVMFRGIIKPSDMTPSDIMLKADALDSNYYYTDTNGGGGTTT